MNGQSNVCMLSGDLAASSSSIEQKKRRILLVDDDEITRNVVGWMVSTVCDVEIYASPQEAKAAFEPGKFDVALIDLGMTQMRGDVLEVSLRQADPTLVTVLITGWLLEDDDARATGFDFRIHKPIEMQILLETIQEAMVLRDQRLNQA